MSALEKWCVTKLAHCIAWIDNLGRDVARANCSAMEYLLNPLLTNGFSHPYHSGRSIFIFRGIRSDFSFLDESKVSEQNSP